MGKKKNNNVTIEGEMQKDVEPLKDDDNKRNDKGQKEDGGAIKVVLKVDMHCDGCEAKIMRNLRSFKGVESVKRSNGRSNELTVTGDVDPVTLCKKLERKTKKKVDLVSPQPKKEKDKDAGDKNKNGENKPEKLFKEIPVTTAVMKLNLHCEGCIHKIRKAVAKTKGYHDLLIDKEKDQITVRGAIDMKALAEALKVKLKKPVEIIQPKKEKDAGEKKDKGGEKKEKGEMGGRQVNEIQAQHDSYGYPYISGYGPGHPVGLFCAPDIFSDENANACSVM